MSNATSGTVWGMFYAWGVDGRIYYLQQTAPTTFTVKAFTPDPTSGAITQQSIGTISGTATQDPDWAAVGDTIYMTVYGGTTPAAAATDNSQRSHKVRSGERHGCQSVRL